MNDYVPGGEAEDLLNLHEVMQAFGVSQWTKRGPVQPQLAQGLSLRVEIAGQHYILRERAEGMLAEDTAHRYAFRQFLQQAGIPIPSLWLTPGGKPPYRLAKTSSSLNRRRMVSASALQARVACSGSTRPPLCLLVSTRFHGVTPGHNSAGRRRRILVESCRGI